jgi:hypothetical protein
MALITVRPRLSAWALRLLRRRGRRRDAWLRAIAAAATMFQDARNRRDHID